MKKPLLLLTSSAFVLASIMPSLPPAAADEGIAAGAYWTWSFGGENTGEASPEFGFRAGRQVEGQPAIVPDSSLGGDGYVPMQSFMDLKFNDEGPVAFNFAGVNTLPYIGPTLGFHGDPDEPWTSTEHGLIIGGAGVGAALIICAIAGCFGGDDEDGGGGGDDDDDDDDGGDSSDM